MDKIKKLTDVEFKNISSQHPFGDIILAKDYYITIILYLIKDVDGIFFKGGTALQKIFLNYSRLSEDIDFSLTKEVSEIKKEITKILEDSGLFQKITKDKDVEGFTRLIAHYKNFSNESDAIFIDLNKRARLLLNPEVHKVPHFYKGFIPEFSFKTVAKEEMIAEKIMAASGRNKPRDHYDIFQIIKLKLPINMDIIKKKAKAANEEFSVIKMFNKAKKLKRRWDDDLVPLITEEVTFQEIMKTLSRHFNLEEEKEKLKCHTNFHHQA